MILLPLHNSSHFHIKFQFFSLFFVVFLFLSSGFSFSLAIAPRGEATATSAMKVHPVPTKKRNNITIRCYDNNLNSGSLRNLSTGAHKKLRRLPHIFTRVLELPLRSDADVAVEEKADCFKFVAETDGIGEVRAHMIQIHPGVTKIVVRPNGSVEFSSLDELELDMWRFRLPETTRPELASAVYVDGELIVTVPKGGGLEGVEERESGGRAGSDGGENGEFRGGMGNNNNNRLVLVQ